jgi:hypothetical protein
MALNVMRKDETKSSLRAKFKTAWNTDYLVKLIPLFCNAITLSSAGTELT